MTDNEQRAHDIASSYLQAALIKVTGKDLGDEIARATNPDLVAKENNAIHNIYLPIYNSVLSLLNGH
jgi:hypothetical protein